MGQQNIKVRNSLRVKVKSRVWLKIMVKISIRLMAASSRSSNLDTF